MRKDKMFPYDILLKNVLENNLIGIFLLNPAWNDNQLTDFEISYINRKSEDLFKRKRLKGKSFLKEFPSCRNSVLHERLKSNIISGEKWSGEYHFEQDDHSLWTNIEIEKAGKQCLMMIMEIPGKKLGEIANARQDQLEALLDNNPSLIFMKDQEGRYVYLNKTYERQFVHIRNWSGKTDYDFWPEKSAELFRANDSEVLRTGSVHQFIEDSTDKDGRRYCWINYKFPFTDSKGNKYVGGIGIDATDRIIAEEALRDSETLLRETRMKDEMLIKYAPTGIYELDYTIPKFLSVNDAMCQITGYSREELLTMSPFQLLDKQSADNFGQRIRKILSGEIIPENIEYKIRVKDGRELWTALNIKIISKGQDSRALVIAHDITQRKQLEEKLKKYNETLEEQVRLRSEEITGERKKSEIALLSERKRLYEILDTLPAMISLLTPDYQIAFANRIFLHKFGELKGRPCYEHCYNNNEPCEFCQAFNVLKTGKPHNWEVSLPDGTILDVNDFPFTDIDGSPRILEIDFDITKQKTAEAELRGQKEYLFNLNEEILRSNKELESFAYITSHDLQEPLRMMTSFAQLLALKYKGQLDKTGEEYIDFIVGGAKRMYDLINGLLAYSRISRKEVEFSKVDINNVIETVKANLDIVIKERNCTIDYVNLPVIVSDRNQLIQLFQNLISNAIKFSRRNPHITISAKKAKSEYIFSVKDRGIGIEPQYFEKIFEIFKRLNTRVEFEGTGIGLAICKKIVENHNGRIWVESEPSKGSVFHFTIPLNIKK